MRKVAIIFALIVFFFIVKGQDVKIVEINEYYKQESRFRPFRFIDRKFDLSTIHKIAILKGKTSNSGKNTLDYLYNSLWIKANENGANSFFIDSTYSVLDTTYVIISIYNLTSPQLEISRNLNPRNRVYILGDIDKKKQKVRTIKLNNIKILIGTYEYISYQNKVDEEAIVSYGGISGSKLWIKGANNREPVFLSLKGFNIAPIYYLNSDDVGVRLTSGRIFPVDLDFGMFLINIMNEKL